MFINLKTTTGKEIYFNTKDIRKFYKEEDYTVLVLTYGTECIKETPEIINEAVKGVYHEVFHTV